MKKYQLALEVKASFLFYKLMSTYKFIIQLDDFNLADVIVMAKLKLSSLFPDVLMFVL